MSDWKVKLVYEGGPLDGDSNSKATTMNPETMIVIHWGDRAASGEQWGYTVADRRIDRKGGTAVLKLRWGTL